eukprot:gene9257-1344_t
MTEYSQYQLSEYLGSELPNEKTFTITKQTTPELKDKEVLLKVVDLSVDPYMRGRMGKGALAGFGSYSLNSEIPTMGVGKVVESKNEDYKVGDYYTGSLSLSEYYVLKEGTKLTKVDPSVPLHLYLSVFGLTGATAYYGTVGILEVKKDDVFVINAASGACGFVAGRIAKLRGAYVVGITGDDEKVDHVIKKHGFDAAINYKNHNNFEEFSKALKEKCPKGIDRYFDNVGGYQTDAVLELMNYGGRMAICGQISYYNSAPHFPKFTLAQLIYKNIRIEGFVVSPFFATPLFGQFLKEMSEWIKTGQIVSDDTIFKGFDKVPEAFLALFTGKKLGKVIISLSEK